MIGLLGCARERGKFLAVHVPYSFGILDTQNPPHRNGVIARTEQLLTRGEPFLLRLHCLEIEGRHFAEQRYSRGAESFHGVLGKSIGAADQPTVLAAVGAPDQGLVAGVELLDALIGLDHFRAGDSNPPLFGNHDPRTGRGRQSGAAKCPGLTADQSDDCNAGAASLDDGTHQLGDHKLSGICFLQTDPAAIQKQQNSLRQVFMIACRADQANHLSAADFAERSTHELAFLSGYKDILSVQPAAADDNSVVESRRQVEQRKGGALYTFGGPQEFRKTVRVQQARDTLACRRLKPAGLAIKRCIRNHTLSINAQACINRRKTVSGRAPPSLMEMRSPPGEKRSTNSSTTAFQVSS